jgi:hypothetical protein
MLLFDLARLVLIKYRYQAKNKHLLLSYAMYNNKQSGMPFSAVTTYAYRYINTATKRLYGKQV